MRDRIISKQVLMLLDRMDVYPEEFVQGGHLSSFNSQGKWNYVLTSGEFNVIERFLLRRKMKKLRREATQQQILSTILYEPAEDEVQDESNSPRLSTTSRFSPELARQALMAKAIQKRVRQV